MNSSIELPPLHSGVLFLLFQLNSSETNSLKWSTILPKSSTKIYADASCIIIIYPPSDMQYLVGAQPFPMASNILCRPAFWWDPEEWVLWYIDNILIRSTHENRKWCTSPKWKLSGSVGDSVRWFWLVLSSKQAGLPLHIFLWPTTVSNLVQIMWKTSARNRSLGCNISIITASGAERRWKCGRQCSG